MTFKKWFFLFWTTLLVGIGAAVATGLVQEWVAGVRFGNAWVSEFTYSIVGQLWGGLLFSLAAQLGFFCFIVLNFLMMTLFRSSRWYQLVLWFLLAFAFVDVIYLRYTVFANAEETIWGYIWFPLGLLLFSFMIAWWKSQATNIRAFPATAFFMFVFTLIELIPALMENNPNSIVFMLFPLLACNTWQIMQLHRLVGKKSS